MKFSRMYELAFGCHHKMLSRVFTIDRRTYQVCLNCGRKVDYSWTQMRSLDLNALEGLDGQRNSRGTEVAMI